MLLWLVWGIISHTPLNIYMKIHEIIYLSEAPIPDEWDSAQNKNKTGKVFSPQTSFEERINYAAEKVGKLGAGSSRTAFTVQYEGRPTVVKIAHNDRGIAQNKAEIGILSDPTLARLGIMIPMIDYDTNHTDPLWIHTEKADQIFDLEKSLKSFSVSILYDLADAIAKGLSTRAKKYADYYADGCANEYGAVSVQPALHMAEKWATLANAGVLLGDLKKAENWGMYKGKPVLIDVGFTRDVFQQHYSS